MKFSLATSVWSATFQAARGQRFFSLFTLGTALTLSAAAVPIGSQFSEAAEHFPGCGCDLTEPTCGAAISEPSCGAACDSPGCDSPGCGCKTFSGRSCNSRRTGLPSLGEGLLDGLDKMTDRFENGVSKLLSSGGRSRSSACCSTGDSCACSTTGEIFGDAELAPPSPPPALHSHSHATIPSTGMESNAPSMPKSPESVPSTPAQTGQPDRLPQEFPSPLPAPPKADRVGNPFLDEARSRRKEQPQVHVAKIQTSVRGSSRRRYEAPNLSKVIEAVEPNLLSTPEVVTAGSVQSSRKSAGDFAR